MKRTVKFVVGIVVLTLVSGLLSFGSPAAAHGPVEDGCSAVPDSGLLFNFHDSCDAHDRCYVYTPYGNSSAGRSTCDSVFYQDMLNDCRAMWPIWYQSFQRAGCRGVAWTYYIGVRTFGGVFFGPA